MILIKTIKTILSFLVLSQLDCLTLNAVCYKWYEYNGKHCQLLDCSIGYNCNRNECTSNAETCDEYESILSELNSKRNAILDRAFTEGLIKWISFSSRRLIKFDKLIKNIEPC